MRLVQWVPYVSALGMACGMLWGSDGATPGMAKKHSCREIVLAKGGHKHGLTAYGKAGLRLETGEQVSVPVVSADPFIVVPIAADENLHKNVRFDEQTHALVVEQSGTYLANFFLKAGNTASSQLTGEIAIALRRSHGQKEHFLARTKLVPIISTDREPGFAESSGPNVPGPFWIAFGTYQALIHLCEGDHLQLVITDLPGFGFGKDLAAATNLTNEWFYFGGGQPESDEVAYVTLMRVGPSKDE